MNDVIILSDAIMSAIRTFILIFSFISLIYALSISLFMKSTFNHFKVDGISAIIPFYNIFVLLKCLKLPEFYGLLMFVPIGNVAFIIFLNMKLSEFFDKNIDYTWGLTFVAFAYMPNLVSDKGKNVRATAKKRPVSSVPKYSMKNMDTNLLTDKELENLNKQKDENESVDSIFKADIDMVESASPYKAGKQKMKVVDDEPKYERETIKRVESVKARDIKRDGKFIKEEDIIEKIDL